MLMKKDVEYVKKRFEGAFDVKYREIMNFKLLFLIFLDKESYR